MEQEKTKTMRFAERYWKNHGYSFKLVKQYISKANYLVGKSGVTMKYSIPGVWADGPGFMNSFEYSFDLFERGVRMGAWESEGVI